MSLTKKIGRFETLIETGQVSAGAGPVDIEVGYNGEYRTADVFPAPGILVAGAASRLNVKVDDFGYASMSIGAASFGNVSVKFGEDASGGITANATSGGFGNIDVAFSGFETSGTVNLRASGDVGNITLRSTNISGNTARVDVEASGNIGNIRLDANGAYTETQVSGRAFGGDIGNFTGTWRGASASGSAYLSAFAVLDGNGDAQGGNIGDISLRGLGASADPYGNLRADGAISAGVWKGGGSIGDISLQSTGQSAEVQVRARAYSGGTIGDIDLLVYGRNFGSASAEVYASAWGGGGKVAEIGDISVTVRSTQSSDNSGFVEANAYNGGNIGNVTSRATDRGSYSTQLDVRLDAETAASGGGGHIGNITVSNMSWQGDTELLVSAGASVGNIRMDIGHGAHSAVIRLNGTADVGNITVGFDRRNADADATADGGRSWFDLQMADGVGGSEIGRITLTGGSDASFYRIGNRIGDDFGQAKATSVEAVDASRFEGGLRINLADVDEGTTIRASRGGSDIRGTEGTDRITLGAGADIVRLDPLGFQPSEDDVILSFTVTGARLDKLDVVGTPTLDATVFDLSSTPAGELADGALLRILQPTGEDITTEAGLVAAADAFIDDGVFELAANAKATVIAAASATARTWYVYQVQELDGVAGAWDEATLVAEVQASHGVASLTSDNFI